MTTKFRTMMSSQSKSGGGGGMHTKGYEGSQLTDGGPTQSGSAVSTSVSPSLSIPSSQTSTGVELLSSVSFRHSANALKTIGLKCRWASYDPSISNFAFFDNLPVLGSC
jgi:hypothetical protein